ncbi:MAG: sigma-70 family RNA polymerase sigma factor [Planctomycetota bacterium]|nr:MAG: sigma-70 family RNA polymerase sigma factor [Planctomycetota bacterium]
MRRRRPERVRIISRFGERFGSENAVQFQTATIRPGPVCMSEQQPETSDEQLLAAVRDGDAHAAAELAQRYQGAITRYCDSYLHDAARAEDIAQEMFAKLCNTENLPSGPVKPWLYRVARNRCLDLLRRQQRSPTHHNRIRTGFDAARAERRQLIRQIIDEMPEDYRSVLILKYYEDLSRAEMAEALGVTEATVKGRLARASEYLHEQLRKLTGTDS